MAFHFGLSISLCVCACIWMQSEYVLCFDSPRIQLLWSLGLVGCFVHLRINIYWDNEMWEPWFPHPFSRDLAGVRKRMQDKPKTDNRQHTYTDSHLYVALHRLGHQETLSFYYNISLFDRMLCDQTTGSFNKQNVLACEHSTASHCIRLSVLCVCIVYLDGLLLLLQSH